MLLAPQIAAIIMLLTAFGVDPIITADVQRILEGKPAITSTATTTTTTMTQAQPPASAPSAGNGATAPALTGNEGTTAAPAPAVATAPASKARIDVINYRPGSGLNMPHSTSSDFDERGNPKNELDIGAVVYGEDGEPTRGAVVTIVATDSSQNKTENGTGSVTPIYVNGQKNVVPVYSFHYEFKAVGEHTITFSSGGVSKSVTVTVSE